MSGISLTEQQWQRQIIDLAHRLGYAVAHFRPARTLHGWRTPVAADGQGWPDLMMAKPGRFVAAELKTDKGKETPEQTVWIARLREAGIEAYVWRPMHFDQILRILSGREPDQGEDSSLTKRSRPRWEVRPRTVDYRATEATARAERAEAELRDLRAEVEMLRSGEGEAH